MRAAPRRIIASAASSGRRQAVGADRPAGGEGEGIGRGAGGDDADDLGPAAERLARHDRAADAAAEPDRHIDEIEIGQRAEKFERIASDPARQKRVIGAHKMKPVALGEQGGVFVGGLEVVPGLDETGAERRHRPILFAAVAVRHDDRRGNTEPPRRKGNALPVIAARGGDDAFEIGAGAPHVVEIEEAAADLEGADRRVVLVLDPQLGADPPRQERPAILRRRRHDLMHEFGGGFENGKGGHAGLPASCPAWKWPRSRRNVSSGASSGT
jgi:hypothetical protein